MIIKAIGIVFIMASTVMLGFYYGSIEAFRIAELLEMKRGLTILSSELSFMLTPIKEAALIVSMRTKGTTSQMFKLFNQLLSENKNETTSQLFETAASQIKNDTYLTVEDLSQISTVGRTISQMDSLLFAKSVEQAKSYIDETIRQLNEAKQKNAKLYKSLGFLTGTLIVIIFI